MLVEHDQIKCIFLSEFHPNKGPKITYQVPSDYISKDVFDALHVYIIPKRELRNRVITIDALGHKILGCPVCIDDRKYRRNAFIFNLCLVFNVNVDTCKYETVVRKLADCLTRLELGREYLSNVDSRRRLPCVLSEMLTRLNTCGHGSFSMCENNTIHLKVSSSAFISHSPAIEDHEVPILVPGHSKLNTGYWDLATQQLICYIDGFNHVQRIALESGMEINLVKACIQNLLYFNFVTIISIFQYSNVYTTTSKLTELATSTDRQMECVGFVSLDERVNHGLPKISEIFALYAQLSPGTTVRDLCLRCNPRGLHIEEKNLIQYGLIRGYIRRLHKYPILLSDHGTHTHNVGERLSRLCDGRHNYDDICCKLGLTCQELEKKLERNHNIVIIMK